MPRRGAPVVLVAVVLLAGCGQRAGTHSRFTPVYRQEVAQSTTAHGESAKTRVVKTKKVLVTKERIPGGHSILDVPDPERGADGTLFVSWPQWAALLLDRLEAPRCANNLIAVVAWAAQEGTDAGWNPLATTLDYPNSTLFNSAGVKNYPSLEDGLTATVLTLEGGLEAHGYGAIVDDLRACADPLVTAAAIQASDWCAGCAGGQYVLGVIPEVISDYVKQVKANAS